jgi:hypothetical protein
MEVAGDQHRDDEAVDAEDTGEDGGHDHYVLSKDCEQRFCE